METFDEPYITRLATHADAEVIAHQRASMFQDMGTISDEEVKTLFAASVPWLRQLITAQQYIGWLVVCGTGIVAGGGLHMRESGPVPGCFRTGRVGHIGNVYTVSTHRRRGLARVVLQTIVNWAEVNGLDELTLAASAEGRPLYASLGFVPTNDMVMRLKALV